MAGKKAKKAFTLIELIIVLGLVGVVGLGITLIFVSANDSVVTLASQTDVSVKTNFIMESVQTRLRYAKNMSIHETASGAGSDADRTYLYSSEGRVYVQNGRDAPQDLFSEAFYEGYYTDLTVTAIQQNIVTVQVAMTNRDDLSVAYSLATDVNVLNTETVDGDTWGLMVSYDNALP